MNYWFGPTSLLEPTPMMSVIIFREKAVWKCRIYRTASASSAIPIELHLHTYENTEVEEWELVSIVFNTACKI